MAVRAHRRSKSLRILVPTSVHPNYRKVAVATAGAPISVADVERAAAATPAPVSPRAAPAAAPSGPVATPAAGPGPEEAMRAAIAAAMSRSKREIPHYYLGSEIDVEAAHQWLERYNAARPLAGRVLFAALALRAVALRRRSAASILVICIGAVAGKRRSREMSHTPLETVVRFRAFCSSTSSRARPHESWVPLRASR